MWLSLWLLPGPSQTTLATHAMTSRKLFGKELNDFDDVDVDDLLTQLSAEELEILSKEVDPDVRINFKFVCHEKLYSFF